MLAQVRADLPDGEPASPREVLASPVGEQRAAELISEAAIVVDSAGTALAPPPAAKPATAPSKPLPWRINPPPPRLLPPRKTPPRPLLRPSRKSKKHLRPRGSPRAALRASPASMLIPT